MTKGYLYHGIIGENKMFLDEDKQIASLVADKLQGHTKAYTYCNFFKEIRERNFEKIMERIYNEINENLELGHSYCAQALIINTGDLLGDKQITNTEKMKITNRLESDGFKLDFQTKSINRDLLEMTMTIYWFKITK